VLRDKYVPPYALALLHAGLNHREAASIAADKSKDRQNHHHWIERPHGRIARTRCR
jgi:hypothetical protein